VLALLEWLSDRWMEKVVLLCALIGLGIGVQLRNENDFRWSWVNQTRISWQLFWRAPSITPNTLFTSDQDIMTYNRPTFAFNLLYLQPRGTHQLPYWYSLLGRDQAVDIPSLLAGSDVQATHRDFTFNAKSHDSLMLYYDSKFANCLWVLGPQDQNDPYLPAITLQALPLSNLNRIQAQPFSGNYPDTNIFGKEPSHGWCYYYEKTDLARQLGDWEQVSELGDQARAKGFSPNASESNSPHEWEPIIEGYARTGRWADASQITLTSFQKDPNYQAALCNLWNRVKDQPGAETDYQRMVNQLGCK
jgi:hypothetical protein